jgi:hypothetical protein
MNRRQQWFADGAAALRRTATAIEQDTGVGAVLPPHGDFYACPCCLDAYGPAALDTHDLTDEHVPPKNAGGKKLVLTCKSCNNEAGSRLDAHADRRTAAEDLRAGRGTGRTHRVEVAIDGTILRYTMIDVGEAVLLSVAPTANNPADIDDAERTLDDWAAAGVVDGRFGFRLTQKVSLHQARLSWVRAAYLAAFAAFGYRYAFLTQLAPLRAQLAEPETELLPPLDMIDCDAPADRRQLLVIREPVELRSLAVSIGQHTLFLPAPDEPRPFQTIAEELGELAAAVRRPRLLGAEVPWPTEPQYALDR